MIMVATRKREKGKKIGLLSGALIFVHKFRRPHIPETEPPSNLLMHSTERSHRMQGKATTSKATKRQKPTQKPMSPQKPHKTATL